MNRTHYAVALVALLSNLFNVVTQLMISVWPRTFAVVCTALVSVASAGVASAQSCYSVRDAQGKVVYQSVKAPVDVTVPFKDEIEALFPGGYMQIDTNFFRCGSYERPGVVDAQANYAPAKQKGLFDDMPAVAPDTLERHPPRQPHNANASDTTPGVFDHLIPKSVTDDVPVGIFDGHQKSRVVSSISTIDPTQTTNSIFLVAIWILIALFAASIFVLVNRLNEGRIQWFGVWVFLLRALRFLLGVVLLMQFWFLYQALRFAFDNPALFGRLELVVPVLIKLVWMAVLLLSYDFLRRRINVRHMAKYGVPHPAMVDRWGV